MNKIAIIGAGCSGITALKTLVQAGLTNVACFEKSDQIGGNWVFTAGDGHSSVCETTHIISSKQRSQYSDYPMPADYPDYPSHRQILAYFQGYARHFGLERYIRFQTPVLTAAKTADDRWQLTLGDGSSEVFDYLLVANGHHSVPRHPAWKDDFKGEYRHSHGYKHNRDFVGKRVLVVGIGNSGCDCAVEISRVAETVDIAVRTPQYIVPKFFIGKPTDTFAANLQWLPRAVQDVLHKISLRIQVGSYADYGLPAPDFPVTRSHPTVNSELLDKIRHGKVHPKPGVTRIEGQTVHFADGQSGTYDCLVAATGYKMAFPFFDKQLLDWEDATHIPLYLRVFHPEHRNLFFVGLVQPQGSVWPLAEAQSRIVARLIAGKWQLPTDLSAKAEAEAKAIGRDFLQRPRHAVEVHYLPYLRKLKRIGV